MRLIALIGTLCWLMYLVSCNDVVGPVPEFEFEFDDFDDISVTPVDTTTLEVDGVPITPGDVTNDAFSSLADLTPAQLNNLATVFDGAISAAQRAFWESQTQSSALTAISSNDAAFLDQLESIRTTFENNPSLQVYLPVETNPINGRQAGRFGGSQGENAATNTTGPVPPATGIEQDFDDCIQAAQDIFEATIARLEDERDAELAKIEIRYQNLLRIITSENEQAVARHDARLEAYLTTYNNIVTQIENLVAQGDITSDVGDSILLLALNVYSFNVFASFTILAAEQALISASETALNNARDAFVAQVQNDFSTQASLADTTRVEVQAQCHNQGSGSGN